MKAVDDAAYQRGVRAFTKKATLRSMVEALIASERRPDNAKQLSGDQMEAAHKAKEQEQVEAASAILGYLDGFIARIQRM